MGSSATSNVYIHVIDDVISKVRDEFINNGGPGEGVLNELQGMWELKMIQAGVILGPATQKGAPVHDLNMYNYQGVVSEDYNVVNTSLSNEMVAAATPAHVQNDVVDDDDDEPLNEGDDDDDDEPLNEDDDLDDVEGEDITTPHLVLAKFDKVTKTQKNNCWKGTLKDGIMHINNKDILFNKANGEFEFYYVDSA